MAFSKQFTFSLNWLLAIFVLAIALITAFIYGPDRWHTNLVFAGAILAATAGVANAGNALDLRGQTLASADAAALHVRICASLAFIHAWNSPAFYHSKKNGRAVLAHFKTEPTIEKQLQYLENNAMHLANIIDVFNTFEAMEIAIAKKVVDEDTVKQFFRGVVINYWHLTEAVIKSRRADKNNPRLYCEFEKLYQRWKV